MKIFITLSLLVLSQPLFAQIHECELKDKHQVFLVGESHGTKEAVELKNLMIQGALRKKIYLGLEIDPASLQATLKPENRDAIFGTEEPFSKGFGVAYWAWWLSESRLLFRSLSHADLQNALSSLHYFVLTNTYLKEAWSKGLLDKTVAESTNPLVKKFVNVINSSLENKLSPDQADWPLPIVSEDGRTIDRQALEASRIVSKAVLRAYVAMAMALPANIADFYIPENLNRVLEILNYPAIIPGDRNFYIFQRDIWMLNLRLKQMFVIDWRSEQMNRSILKHLCRMEADGKANLPYVVIAGADHLSLMEKLLKQNSNIDSSLSVPPKNYSDFDRLIEQLKK